MTEQLPESVKLNIVQMAKHILAPVMKEASLGNYAMSLNRLVDALTIRALPQQGQTSQTIDQVEAQGGASTPQGKVNQDRSLSLAEVEAIASREWVESYTDNRIDPARSSRKIVISVGERDRLVAELRRRIESES